MEAEAVPGVGSGEICLECGGWSSPSASALWMELVPHNVFPLPPQDRKEGEKIRRLKAMSLQANHCLVSCPQSGVV